MPTNNKRQHRITPHIVNLVGLKALTKHARTIDDLLTHSDVNEVLENVVAQKSDIDEVLIIYKTHKDKQIHWCASDLELRECLWMIKIVEQALLNDDEEDN